MPEWLTDLLPEDTTGWHVVIVGVLLSVTSATASILLIGYVLAQLPPDYFVNPEARGPAQRHPVLRVLLIVIRNLCGYILVVLGAIMSLPGVPGQGILTILMGVMLIDFPGKRRVERWLLSRKGVLSTINAMRTRMGRPPLIAQSSAPE
jgi:hypothetical protein